MGASWDALRVFIAVFRAGSFTAAADELGVAQSSVSEQIARLERKLGYRLLDRGPSGVRATDRGLELATRIADAIDSLAAATAFASEDEQSTRSVYVGGPAEFLSEVILPVLGTRLPDGVRIVARFAMANELIHDLRAGTIDVLVSSVPARGHDLSAEPIYDEEFGLVAHPRWAGQAADDLDQVPVLTYGPELPIIRRYWRGVFGRRPSQLRVEVIAPDLRSLLRLALDGIGMTVLPDYLIRQHLGSGALIELYSPEVAPLNTLYVASRNPRSVPDPVVVAVREAITAVAREAN